jgi:hypothetical protein
VARTISWRGLLSPDGPDTGRPVWRPGTPLRPPRTTIDSARLMRFAAALNLLEIVRAFLTRDDLRAAVVAEATSGRLLTTDAGVDRVVQVSLTVTTVVAVVSAVVWLLMSRATMRGSKWGRVIACVLFAFAIGGFLAGALPTAGPFARVLALALLLLGAWALVLQWRPDSSAYIRYQGTPQE